MMKDGKMGACARLIWFAVFLLSPIAQAHPADSRTGNLVEIDIRNSTFEVQGPIVKVDQTVTLVIHNHDKITHGFTSVSLPDLDVKIASEGVTTLGKGIKAIHIDAGKSVWIQFIPNQPGRISFSCDLHPEMKGELLILSVESI